MYEALGVKNISSILPPPQQSQPLDPSMEEIAAMAGKPFQAFVGQDHKAHIDAHLNFMKSNTVQNNPMVMGALQKNILERISLMAQEQIQLEFREELMQARQIQMALQQNPNDPALIQQANQLTQTMNARKAVLIAEMTKDYMDEEQKIISEFGGDPLIKLKTRELDLRARQNEARAAYDEGRISLDTLKAMMNQQNTQEKLEQNEDLAELRAETSIAKTILSGENSIRRQQMADASKIHDFGRNFGKK